MEIDYNHNLGKPSVKFLISELQKIVDDHPHINFHKVGVSLNSGEYGMKLELTEAQQEAIILTILKRDLQNVQEEVDELYNMPPDSGYVQRSMEVAKKNIKMLKRAINFYSVTDEY